MVAHVWKTAKFVPKPAPSSPKVKGYCFNILCNNMRNLVHVLRCVGFKMIKNELLSCVSILIYNNNFETIQNSAPNVEFWYFLHFAEIMEEGTGVSSSQGAQRAVYVLIRIHKQPWWTGQLYYPLSLHNFVPIQIAWNLHTSSKFYVSRWERMCFLEWPWQLW